MVDFSLLRPVRNNNPLDIEATQPWQGLLPFDQMSPVQLAEPRFAVFKSPAWGFRAGVVLLRNYDRNYGINTIEKLCARFAPASENNLGAYIGTVCNMTGWGRDASLDMESALVLMKLVRAFATQETGAWSPPWRDYDLEQGALLAGFQTQDLAKWDEEKANVE